MLLLGLTTLTGIASVPKHAHDWVQHSYISLPSLICHSIMAGSQENWWFLDLSLFPLVWSVGLLKLELKLTLKLMLEEWGKVD